MGRTQLVTSGIGRQATYSRLIETGKADLAPNGWAYNRIPNWSQGEWISPLLVREFVAQGLCEQKETKIVVTPYGLKHSYDDSKDGKHYTRVEAEDTTDPQETKKRGKSGVEQDEKEPVEPRVKRTVAAGKLTETTELQLLNTQRNLKRGREEMIINLWKAQPNQATTIANLSEVYAAAAGMREDLAFRNVRHFMKVQLDRGDAQII